VDFVSVFGPNEIILSGVQRADSADHHRRRSAGDHRVLGIDFDGTSPNAVNKGKSA
jgi:hypothetical protein